MKENSKRIGALLTYTHCKHRRALEFPDSRDVQALIIPTPNFNRMNLITVKSVFPFLINAWDRIMLLVLGMVLAGTAAGESPHEKLAPEDALQRDMAEA